MRTHSVARRATSASFPSNACRALGGAPQATTATAHKLARIIYHVPFVEVHPAECPAKCRTRGWSLRPRQFGLWDVRVFKVTVTDSQRRGSLFAPIHWNDKTASEARVGDLVTPANDPYSGQPEAKATPAVIKPVSLAYRGFLLARALPMDVMPRGTWWARVAVANGKGLLFASDEPPGAWRTRAAALLGAHETARIF